jgi:hypothetical protein
MALLFASLASTAAIVSNLVIADKYPTLNTLTGEELFRGIEVRLEIYSYAAVFISSSVFNLLVSLSNSTSFMLSEYDILANEKNSDLHQVEFLERRFIENNKFGTFFAPAIITSCVFLFNGNLFDTTSSDFWQFYSGMIFVPYLMALCGIIIFFVDIRVSKSCVVLKKVVYGAAIAFGYLILPIGYWCYFLLMQPDPMWAFPLLYNAWIYALLAVYIYPPLELIFKFTAIDCCMNRAFHKDRWYQAFICDGKY